MGPSPIWRAKDISIGILVALEYLFIKSNIRLNKSLFYNMLLLEMDEGMYIFPKLCLVPIPIILFDNCA